MLRLVVVRASVQDTYIGLRSFQIPNDHKYPCTTSSGSGSVVVVVVVVGRIGSDENGKQ